MISRGRILIALFAAILVAGVLLLIFLRPQKIQYYSSGILGKNINFAEMKEDSIFFFSGHNFSKISTRDYKTTAISKEYNFPVLENVQYGSNKVLFKASGASSVDDLYSILVANSLDTEEPHWWVIDMNTKQLSLLSAVNKNNYIESAMIKSDVIYAVESGYENSHEKTEKYMYKISSTQREQIGKLNPKYSYPEIVAEYGNTIYLQKSSIDLQNPQNSLIGISNGKETLIDEKIEFPQAGSNNKIFYKKTSELGQHDTVGDIIEFDASGVKKIIKKNSSEVIFVDKNSGVLLIKGEGDILYEGGKLKQLDADQDFYKVDANQIFKKAPNAYMAVDGAYTLYLISTDQKSSEVVNKNAITSPEIPRDYFGDGFNIRNLDDSDAYEVYITKDPYLTNQQKALNYLQSKGMDTNLANIIWLAYPSVKK